MKSQPSSKIMLGRRYQDYFMTDGNLVGELAAMYQSAAEVPWHQDKTAGRLISNVKTLLHMGRHIYIS